MPCSVAASLSQHMLCRSKWRGAANRKAQWKQAVSLLLPATALRPTWQKKASWARCKPIGVIDEMKPFSRVFICTFLFGMIWPSDRKLPVALRGSTSSNKQSGIYWSSLVHQRSLVAERFCARPSVAWVLWWLPERTNLWPWTFFQLIN